MLGIPSIEQIYSRAGHTLIIAQRLDETKIGYLGPPRDYVVQYVGCLEIAMNISPTMQIFHRHRYVASPD